MKKIGLFLVLLLCAVPVFAQDDLPAWDDLQAGTWTQIEPGGETICATGTPYSFFARPAQEESDKLLIYFQGGGACWFGNICDLDANPTYDPFVDESDQPGPTGIFDYSNEENPFADYNTVFIPYCTGDVFLGDNVRTYSSEATEAFTIYHKGYVNSSTVLDWTFANISDPSTVFVTGSSAGSIPSPFYTEFVAEAYPQARIEQLGDGSGGYRNQVLASVVFGAWGTMDILTDLYEGVRLGEMNFEVFYRRVGEAYPQISFSQYNTAYDETQLSFLELSGLVSLDLYSLMLANFDDINADIENFDAYTAGGIMHTILGRPEFYTYTVDGVRFVDWITQIVDGEDVDSVMCDNCDLAPGDE